MLSEMSVMRCFLLIFLIPLLSGCGTNELKQFSKMPSSQTRIDFVNRLDLKGGFDVFRYRNYYNGGGVAIGDINNDGLADIYLSSNLQKNKLYLNKGNFTFEDITEKAGVGGAKAWSTGVSMADVNGDGLLDIYVCNSGNIKGDNKENELFINQGNLTFKEQAAPYGLDDKGYSTHAAFFDFDLDGDLDCYLLNNSFRPIGSFGVENIRHERDSLGGDKLYRNDNNQFKDISEEAGIYGSVVGFGLGIAVGDLNVDGWPDLYISNDFFERDYLYINQRNGTFRECLTECMRHTSEFAMGSDIGDLNNDGWPEVFVTDMLPASDYRLKTTQSFMSYDVYQTRLKNDYYDQLMRNTLQLNNQNGTFSEVGLYAGVAATDWSWGALIADYDNDRNKEIYVTNGIYRDVTDQDFINFLANDERLAKIERGEKIDFKELVDKMPSTKLENFLFKKQKDVFQFSNRSKEWGLDEPSFSNGAAYGDLDNDGDLDLVVNNVNQELFVYRNNNEKLSKSHYLKIKFKGAGKNPFGVGARVELNGKGDKILYENFPTRGFQSSMEYTATLGVGEWQSIDSLTITWPGNKIQILKDVKTDQTLSLDVKNAVQQALDTGKVKAKEEVKLTPEFVHRENNFVDFNYDRLLYQMLSRQGPALAVADLNADGLDDFYIGGAKDQAGAVYLQQENGFTISPQAAFNSDSLSEDVDARFFDADGDGDLDLYVVSGGSEYEALSPAYADRLYFNLGNKNQPKFERAEKALPNIRESGSCVEAEDYDKDGDMDLFIGVRLIPGKYGMSASSYLLENDGKGNFKDISSEKIPQLKYLGMVTDAVWLDYNKDGLIDLAVVGEWMPVTLFINKGAGFQKQKNVKGLENSQGFWNAVEALDLNGDGYEDLLLGNLGLNSRFKTSEKEPFQLIISDFDQNGSMDHIYAHYQQGKLVPFGLRQDLISQLPYLKKKYLYFKDYAGKSVEEIFEKEKLENATTLQVQTFASQAALNDGKGGFLLKALPEETQFSPIYAFLPLAIEKNQTTEFLTAGNFSAVKPEIGKYDASYGVRIKVNPKGNFYTLPSKQQPSLAVTGDVRKLGLLNSTKNTKLIIFARNDDKPQFYRIQNVIQ